MRKNAALKMALFLRGITLKQLEQKTGIAKSYISQAIHGRFVLDSNQKRKIAEAIGIKQQELFGSVNQNESKRGA